MFQNRFQKLVLGAIVAVGTTVAGMGPAQAVVYRGSWDPAYGSALPDLGWRGEALFDIPTTCLAQGDGLYFNSGVCSPETILSGKVEFYNLSNPGTTLETLTFDSSNIDITIQMRVTNHQLAGVVGAFLLPEESFISLTDTMPGASHSIFWLGFQDSQARLANCQYASWPTCSINTPSSDSKAILNFAPVPEADGYVLALAGLGVVGAAMTRRRRSAPQQTPRG